MTKRLFIVHGWDFNPKMHWCSWIKKELEKKGFMVVIPEINAWVAHLKKGVGELN